MFFVLHHAERKTLLNDYDLGSIRPVVLLN